MSHIKTLLMLISSNVTRFQLICLYQKIENMLHKPATKFFFSSSKLAFSNYFQDSPHALVVLNKLSAAIVTKAKTSDWLQESLF